MRPSTQSYWFTYDEIGIGSGKCLVNYYTEAESFNEALGLMVLWLMENGYKFNGKELVKEEE
jgi:hypothetical protein